MHMVISMVKLECLFLSQTQVNRLTPNINIQILQVDVHKCLVLESLCKIDLYTCKYSVEVNTQNFNSFDQENNYMPCIFW